MNEEERRKMWDNYPDVPNGISEIKREIKDVSDVSVECHRINWNNYPPVEEYNGTGYTNGNKLDIEIGELDNRII